MEENAVRVHRLSIEQLYERVWSTPMQRLAAEFGLSDVGLCKICHKHGIPTPPRGYWMMSDARKAALRPAFQSPATVSDEPIVIRASPSRGALGESPVRIQVVVPETLVDPRPAIAATVRGFRSGKRGDNGLLIPRGKGALPIAIGPQSIDRAARIFNALIHCLEQRGHAFAVNTTERESAMAAKIDGEEVTILFGEAVDREERELTAHEKRLQERNPWLYRQSIYRYSPSGKLFLKIDHYCFGLRKHWADGKRQRLENCLGDFVVQLETVAAQMKADRLEREEDARRRRAWELERSEKLAAIKKEEERLATLNAQVNAWHRSQKLRQFADAVRSAANEGKLRSDAELEKWLAWVSVQADRLDPLVESPQSILDEKSKYEGYY